MERMPDACPYHAALAGIDDVAFLRAVAGRAEELAQHDLAGVFVVGYSNGGHLVFRIAFEAPGDVDALAAIGAHLPVPEECDCDISDQPVSIFLVSGTDDPINPWAGGEVRPPSGASLGHVLSADATADYFRALAGIPRDPTLQRLRDLDADDEVEVENAALESARVTRGRDDGDARRGAYPASPRSRIPS